MSNMAWVALVLVLIVAIVAAAWIRGKRKRDRVRKELKERAMR
jgi:preprotein translocase subunit YajC